MDSDRDEWEGTIATDVNTVRVPAGFQFVRGVQVFNSTANSNEQGHVVTETRSNFFK